MKGSDFVFNYVDRLCYRFHKATLNCCERQKNITINPKHGGDECFQYVVTIRLNYEKILNYSKIMASIEIFIKHNSWTKINVRSG